MAISLRDIRQHRARRRLLDPSRLVELLEEPCADTELRAQIAAELVVRAWLLSGDSQSTCAETEECLKRGLYALGLDAEDIAATTRWCSEQAERRTFTLPSPLHHSPLSLWQLVAFDLENWRTAQGFILFVPNPGSAESGFAREGVALPFILDDTATARTGLLRTVDDSPIGDESLTRAITVAHIVASKAGWLPSGRPAAVKLLTVRRAGDFPIEGESAGMAVLLALALRSGKRSEALPLGFGTSGVLAENGCLVPGAHAPGELLAKEHLLRMMGIAHRLLPSGPRYVFADTVCLPPTQVADGLRASLDRIVPPISTEKATGPLSLSEMETILADVQEGMRYGSVTATEAKARCERILGQVGSSTSVRASDLRIWATANLSSAECHLGHPERSGELCHSVVGEPLCGPRFKAQALVRQAVSLTDMCRYEDAVRTAQEAMSLADILSSATERLDLKLQVTGSMGQALCYWALLDPSKTDDALKALQEGCSLATQLDGDCPTETPDLPRSLCYWYLAHALLRPTAAETVYQQVRDMCSGDPKTHEYLLRIRWLSAYRMLLLRQGLPTTLAGLDMELPSPAAEGGWLNQTAAKYRGALRAAQGDAKGACLDFEVAAKLAERDRAPLLEFIGGTACLQAGRSLLPHVPDVAHGYLTQAATIFKRRRDWFAGLIEGAKWAEHAKTMGSGSTPASTALPQYFYPY